VKVIAVIILLLCHCVDVLIALYVQGFSAAVVKASEVCLTTEESL